MKLPFRSKWILALPLALAGGCAEEAPYEPPDRVKTAPAYDQSKLPPGAQEAMKGNFNPRPSPGGAK
jgi:hypothetical protein